MFSDRITLFDRIIDAINRMLETIATYFPYADNIIYITAAIILIIWLIRHWKK